MKALLKILILLALMSPKLRAEEVFKEVCWFELPAGVQSSKEGKDPGSDPFAMRGKAVRYAPADNSPEAYRELLLSIRLVGATVGEGKQVTIKPVSDAELKEQMPQAIQARDGSTGVQVIPEGSSLARQQALRMHFEVPLKINPGPPVLFRHDYYWVRIRPNYVLEVHLVGAGETALEEVRTWLDRLKIVVSEKSNPDPALR